LALRDLSLPPARAPIISTDDTTAVESPFPVQGPLPPPA
jgi:hypothetical protein